MRAKGAGFVVSLAVSAFSLAGCRREHREHAPRRDTPPPAASAAVAASAASHEGMRPPKPRVSPNEPPPPTLPTLDKQVRYTPLPHTKPTKGDYPCGSVWTGEEEVPLECERPAAKEGFGAPAVALIPYEMLHVPKGDLPRTVDHRLDGFEGRVLAQGSVSACTAFSLASQINHSIGLWTGTPGDVSVMQMWARYHVVHNKNAFAANIGRPLATDADWPYDPVRARAWQACKDGDACLSDDERRRLAELDRKKGVVTLEQVEWLPADGTLFDVMAAKLAAGRDIGSGGTLPRPFATVGEPGSRYVAPPTELGKGKGAHAFSVVGYTHAETDRYFLIKNSWGERWGDKGYAWVHEATLAKIVGGGYVIVIDPVADVGLRRHKRGQTWVTACAANEAPDSVDGACKPLCGDGGPRHGGYCGTTDDCLKGHVNTAGECVLAAPRAKGIEPKSGISFACAPSGCVYTIPKGVEGCNAAQCQKSCPAPDFRLGRGKGGLLCLE